MVEFQYTTMAIGICEETYLEKVSFEFFKPKDNLLPKDNDWKKDFCLLVVALGLSYPKSEGFATWLGEDEYQMNDAEKFKSKSGSDEGLRAEKIRLVAHPFNEDCFIYDVLESKWI